MGRFMSPDPSVLEYANPYNPQSLNLLQLRPEQPTDEYRSDGKPGDGQEVYLLHL